MSKKEFEEKFKEYFHWVLDQRNMQGKLQTWIEQVVKEARIDELKRLHNNVYINGYISDKLDKRLCERIKELEQIK
jgi:hypothetical protein